MLADTRAGKKNIRWEHSCVVADKTFCMCLADSEALVHEHAKRSGFPATRVSAAGNTIDPVTTEAG